MTLTINPRRAAVVIIYKNTKIKVVLKDRMETNGQTDTTDRIIFLAITVGNKDSRRDFLSSEFSSTPVVNFRIFLIGLGTQHIATFYVLQQGLF